MRFIKYVIAVFSAALALSCGKENPQQEEETPKQSFDIQILDLHSSYCKVSVTPEDKNTPYFLGVTTEAYFNEFGSMDNLEETVTNFIETQIIMNPELSIAELMHKGDYTRVYSTEGQNAMIAEANRIVDMGYRDAFLQKSIPQKYVTEQ